MKSTKFKVELLLYILLTFESVIGNDKKRKSTVKPVLEAAASNLFE